MHYASVVPCSCSTPVYSTVYSITVHHDICSTTVYRDTSNEQLTTAAIINKQ